MSARVFARLIPALLVLVLWPLEATFAQDVQVSGSALFAYPTSSVIVDGAREKTHGVWYGGVVELRMGRATITGLGLRGDLTATGNVPALDRDGGEISARGRYDALTFLGLEASYTVRAFTSAAGYQRWNETGVGAVLFHDLLGGAVQVFGRGWYLPWVNVDGQDEPDLSLGTETGVTLTPPGIPVTLSATYNLERYEFPGGDARREQFDRISLAIGIPLQRSGGSWTIGRR